MAEILVGQIKSKCGVYTAQIFKCQEQWILSVTIIGTNNTRIDACNFYNVEQAIEFIKLQEGFCHA